MSDRAFGIESVVLVDGNAAVASVDLIDADTLETVATATGSSMRSPEDKHNEEVAVTLAMGRALEKLGRKLTRRGNGLVKQADNVAESKRARKAEQTASQEKVTVTVPADLPDSVTASIVTTLSKRYGKSNAYQ